LASFEAVTRPRLERWLVRAAGALVAGVGASAPGGLVARWYAGRRRISPVFLADTAALAAGWLAFARRAARGEGEP
jgi:hypothetical protein